MDNKTGSLFLCFAACAEESADDFVVQILASLLLVLTNSKHFVFVNTRFRVLS